MDEKRRNEILEVLKGHFFTLDDLKALCRRLEVDWQSLPHQAKTTLAEGLVDFMEARSRVGELEAAVREALPEIDRSPFDHAPGQAAGGGDEY